jgi:phosphate transport system substrate-binding protein
MDLASTLGLFLAILSGVGILSATLNNLLSQAPDDLPGPASPAVSGAPPTPGQRRARRGQRNRVIVARFTVVVLIVTLAVQYFAAPATSIFTYPFVQGVYFPGSTLKACHVSVSDFPTGRPELAEPQFFTPGLDGKSLHISGSSVLYGLFTAAAHGFDILNNALTSVEKLDSGTGLQDVVDGRVQIGLSDIYVQDDPDPTVQGAARDLLDYQVAVAPFTLLVNSDLKGVVQNLTTRQIIGIFSGTITNWRAIGGPDEPITVYNRKQGSGTRINFEKYVLGISVPSDDLRAATTTILINLIGKTPGSIGYAATTSLIHTDASKVAPVCIDGYGATTENINAGNYEFWSYEHAYIKTPSPIVNAFLDFVCGSVFQTQEVVGNGFLQIEQLRSNAIVTHAVDYPPPQRCS